MRGGRTHIFQSSYVISTLEHAGELWETLENVVSIGKPYGKAEHIGEPPRGVPFAKLRSL
jgi:hypothetical protein